MIVKHIFLPGRCPGKVKSKRPVKSRTAWSLLLLVFGLLATPVRAEWTASAYVGFAHTTNGPLSVAEVARETQLNLLDVAWDGRSFDRPLYWGGRAGFSLAKIGIFDIGPEFEWIHLKVFLDTNDVKQVEGVLEGTEVNGPLPVRQVLEQFSISHGSNLLLANLAFRSESFPALDWAGLDSRLVVRVGYGANLSHLEGTLAGREKMENWDFAGDAFQTAVGIEVPLWELLSGMLEYKYTSTDPSGELSPGIEVGADLDTHHLVFGLTFDFGR